jgi:hypothetical protein
MLLFLLFGIANKTKTFYWLKSKKRANNKNNQQPTATTTAVFIEHFFWLIDCKRFL